MSLTETFPVNELRQNYFKPNQLIQRKQTCMTESSTGGTDCYIFLLVRNVSFNVFQKLPLQCSRLVRRELRLARRDW